MLRLVDHPVQAVVAVLGVDVVVTGEPLEAAALVIVLVVVLVVVLAARSGRNGADTRTGERARGGYSRAEQTGAAQERAPAPVLGAKLRVRGRQVESGGQVAAADPDLVVVVVVPMAVAHVSS